MNRDAIVFAMANPVPEILPEEAGNSVRVMATGRSDYPNQINNSCGFPGFFRGLLDVRARQVNDEMKLAAANAIAGIVGKSELSEEYITPSMFDPRLVPAVSQAVADAAIRTGVARRKRQARPVGLSGERRAHEPSQDRRARTLRSRLSCARSASFRRPRASSSARWPAKPRSTPRPRATPCKLLGGAGAGAALVQAVEQGARVEAALRQVVRRRQDERLLQLPRPPGRRRPRQTRPRSSGKASPATQRGSLTYGELYRRGLQVRQRR